MPQVALCRAGTTLILQQAARDALEKGGFLTHPIEAKRAGKK
jgi:hypothetical protein